MSRKRPPDWAQVRGDLAALKDAGYSVKGKVITHWRVRKQGYDIVVDVWPTVRKYMQTGDNGANRYTDIVRAVGSIFTRKTKRTVRIEAEKEWRSGLEKLMGSIGCGQRAHEKTGAVV